MTDGILLAFLAATIYGFLGISFELAAKRNYPNWDYMLYKQICGTVVGLAFTLFLGLPFYRLDIMGMAFLGAVFYLATLWAYLTASREGNIAANWTIINLSVALPVLFSVFWFHDLFTVSKAMGIGLTFLAIILIGGFGGKNRNFTRKWFQWIGVAFLLNGWFVVLLRFVPSGFGAVFTLYFYGLSTGMILLYKLVKNEKWGRAKGIYWVAALGASSHWSGIMLTIKALEIVGKVSAQAGLIVYPITNGLTIITGVVLGTLLLEQKIAARAALGIACGSVAMIFLSLG
jgi:drug/metabolite transporter (DMT)-like permease